MNKRWGIRYNIQVFFIVFFLIINASCAVVSQEVLPAINEDSLLFQIENHNDLDSYKVLIERWIKQSDDRVEKYLKEYVYQSTVQENKVHEANSTYLKGYELSKEDHLYESKGVLEKALTLRLEYSEPREVAICLNQLGIVSHKLGDIERAQNYYFEALDISKSSDIQDVVGSIEINLANLLIDLEDPTNAKEHALRAIQIFREVEDKDSEASTYNILGNIYQQLNSSDTAKIFYRESFRLYSEVDNNSGLAHVSNNLAIISFFENDLDGALENFRKALNYRKKVGDKIHLAQSLNNMAIYYQLTEQFDSALYYNDQSIILAQEVGALLELRDAYMTSEEIYESLNDSDSALNYLKKFIAIKDSIVSQETLDDIRELEAKFETDRQKKELMISKTKIREEKLKSDLVESNATFQMYILLGIIAFISIVGVLALKGYQQKKKSNQLLQDQNEKIKEINVEIEKQHEELKEVHLEIEEKNRDITASITYAKHIQNAMLPSEHEMNLNCNEFGLYFNPRDIVSGDFYWVVNENDKKFIAVADCTGHGVPGAMVSVVCANALNKSVLEEGIHEPGKILDRSAEIILDTFTKGGKTLNDGMDISLICLNKVDETTWNVKYAGANNPVYVVSKNQLTIKEDLIKSKEIFGETSLLELRVNRQPVGKFDRQSPFDTGEVQLKANDLIYLFSDGFADQFGGERGKKYKYSRFKKLLMTINSDDVNHQITSIEKEFNKWKGDIEQIDDVCVIGIRL